MSNIAKQQKKSVNALLHAEFKRIKKRALGAVAAGVQPSEFGICGMMKDDLYRLFKGDGTIDSPKDKAFNAWPKSSGCSAYPILVTDVPKGRNKQNAAIDEYIDSRGMRWAGKQLEARLDLLDHLIEYFKPPVLPRTALLKILRVDMQADGYNHSHGICGALDSATSLGSEVVYKVVRDARYVLSPRSALYPIPLQGLTNAGAYDMHRNAGTLWVGEYGAARKAYALKLADYIARNYTVHLKHKPVSEVQCIFDKVIATGYYNPTLGCKNVHHSRFMCHALKYAQRAGVISTYEKELASSAIVEYLGVRCSVLLNALYLKGLVGSVDFKFVHNQKILLKAYKNWDKLTSRGVL